MLVHNLRVGKARVGMYVMPTYRTAIPAIIVAIHTQEHRALIEYAYSDLNGKNSTNRDITNLRRISKKEYKRLQLESLLQGG